MSYLKKRIRCKIRCEIHNVEEKQLIFLLKISISLYIQPKEDVVFSISYNRVSSVVLILLYFAIK